VARGLLPRPPAFFKALLFLGSGSVIHALSGEQDMRQMGGLRTKIPWTFRTMMCAALAIAGVPFLSGFYSKDAILAGAYHRFPVLFWMGLGSAVLTAFYMTRLFVMTFLGKPKDEHIHEHAHEGGRSMTLPLVVLAVLAVIAGWGAWHETLLPPPRGRIATLRPGGTTTSSTRLRRNAGDLRGPCWARRGALRVRKMRAEASPRLKRPLGWLETAFARKFWFGEVYRDVSCVGLRPRALLPAPRRERRRRPGQRRGARRRRRHLGATDRVVVDGAVRHGLRALGAQGNRPRPQAARPRVPLLGVVAVAALFLFVFLF
jgi:hypothetical protein